MIGPDMNASVRSKISWAGLRANPGVAPLAVIMGVAVSGVSAFCLYALFAKTDVWLNRSKLQRWEKIDVNKPQKLITINQTYREDPKITALKAELSEAYQQK